MMQSSSTHRLSLLLLTASLTITAPARAEATKMVSQRDQMVDAASCFARTAPAMSANLLALNAEKDRWKKAKQLAQGRFACFPDGKQAVAIRGDIFYGELAGSMLNRTPAQLDAIAARASSTAQRPGTGLSDGQFMTAYSQCLLTAEPGKTAAILRAPRATPAERAAVVAYGQTLSDCMPTDISYSMNIPDLRAHLAFAAYRSLLVEGEKTDA